MTGQQFINSIMIDTDRYDNLVTDTTYRAIALDWLNRIVKDISAMQESYHWRWLEKTSTFNTVASQLSYDLPSDIDGYKVLSLKQTTTDVKLYYIPQEEFNRLYPDPTQHTGNTICYTLYANAIRLYPTPSGAIEMTMRFVKTITALADGSGVTDIPAKYDEIVLHGAMSKAYKFDKRLNESVDSYNKYLTGVERMKTDNGMIIDNLDVARGHSTRRYVPLWKTPAGQ